MSLYRIHIDPRCAYCQYGAPLKSTNKVGCTRHGVMAASSHCRSFRYDPFRRLPHTPVKLSHDYSDADFQI